MKNEAKEAFRRTLAWFANNPKRWVNGNLVIKNRRYGVIEDTGVECYCLAGRFMLELNDGKPVDTNVTQISTFLHDKAGVGYSDLYQRNDHASNVFGMLERAKTELV